MVLIDDPSEFVIILQFVIIRLFPWRCASGHYTLFDGKEVARFVLILRRVSDLTVKTDPLTEPI
jgi:hypothetical protein